ncbi:sigma-70 family RNA polymerase sigma factor [Craterilacuibacter sp.]|uniref:sigma-70 family RNA polymerase sigma factor n=1 Tax=Craterilacuibacter sp. TaxID=2870909 RepID=UPI003F333C20
MVDKDAKEALLCSLLSRGLDGDAAAYRRFLGALAPHLRAFYRRRLSACPEDVEDLVQEALLAIHNQRASWARDQPVTAWLYAIARYKLIDFWRRHGRHDRLNVPLDDHHELMAQTDQEARDARHDLAVLLQDLPDGQRLPIVHMKLEGLSVRETAAMTGLSESAVKVAIHRGLKALAAMIRNG